MSQSDKKFRRVLELLFEQMARAREAFLVAKHVFYAKQSNRINSTHYFFSQVYQSCLESSILGLSRLLIQNPDSINFDYLLKYIEQNVDFFPRVSSREVELTLAQHQEWLENYALLILNIKDQRDKAIAHLDKKHINNPAMVFKYPPIPDVEIEELFEVLIKIINTYGGYLVPSQEFRIDVLTPKIRDDFEFVIERISKKESKIGRLPDSLRTSQNHPF